MDHIGEWMAIQNSMKIRREPQSARDLSETSEEDRGAKQLRPWRQVLWVARVANERAGRNLTEQKRRGRQTRRADHQVGLCGESLERGRDLHLNALGLQLRCEPA